MRTFIAIVTIGMLVFSFGAARAADASTPPAKIPPDAIFVLGIDRALIDGALTAPPLSVWNDPAAAAAVAQVSRNLGGWLDGQAKTPPIKPLVREGRWFRFAGFATSSHRYGGSDMAMVMDCGRAASGLAEYMEQMQDFIGREDGAQAVTVAGFTGKQWQYFFAGMHGDTVAVGTPHCIELTVASPAAAVPALAAPLSAPATPLSAPATPLSAPATPLWLTLDLSAAAKGLKRDIDEPVEQARVDAIWPGWRDLAPKFTLTTTPGAAPVGWQTLIDGTGLAGMPLRQLSPALLKQARSGAQFTLAVGIDPGAVVAVLGAVLSDQTRHYLVKDRLTDAQAILTLTGLPPNELAALFTGEVLIQGGWTAGPIPTFAAVLPLAKRNAAEQALVALAERLDWTATEVPGAAKAWTALTSAGLTTIARAGDRLVIGTDAEAFAAYVAHTPGGLELPAAGVLHLRLDTPALARQWLPLAYGLLAKPKPLGDGWTDLLRWQLYQNASDNDPPIAGAARPLASSLLFEDGVIPESSLRLAARLLGWADAAAWDRSVALFPAATTEGARNGGRARLVIRFADGYRIISTVREDVAVLDATSLAKELADAAQLAGPAPAELALTTVPPTPVLDQRWLPPLAVALKHIIPTAIDVELDGGHLHLREQGLPLTAVAGVAAGIGGYQWATIRAMQARWTDFQAKQKPVSERHAEAIASLEAVQKALRSWSNKQKAKDVAGAPAPKKSRRNSRRSWSIQAPEQPSQLVTDGALTLDDCAGLFGGIAPTNAAALDAVGAWTPKPDGVWPQVIWAFTLEPGWAAAVTGYSVELLDDLPNAPPLPQPPADAKPPEALF